MQPSHVVVPLVIAALVGLAVLAWRGHARMLADARALDGTLVEEYCRLVAQERYAEAWEKCLTRDYRKAVSAEKFAAKLRERREKLGPLLGRALRTLQSSRNLFSGTRSFQLQYELQYAQGPQVRVLSVTDADGEMRVDGTFVEAGASDTLDFEYW